MSLKRFPEDSHTTGCYFIRTTPLSDGPIPSPSSTEDALQVMPLHFETGTIYSKPLQSLENMLRHLYIPLLMATGQISDQQQNEEEREEEERSPHKGGAAIKGGGSRVYLRDELLINVQKFTSQIQQTMEQAEGEIRLNIPEIDLSISPRTLAKDQSLVAQLETAVDGWSRVISTTLEDQFKKTPQGNGPLAEIEFWKERNSSLNALFLQLQTPLVQGILAVLKATSSAAQVTFEITRADLNKYYVEAKDNIKFLMTLERHFKIIAHGASFSSVTDTIPAMMNSLRMVWVISRHYNTDERMIPLMERIAWELCERVARVIDVKIIFK